MTRRRSLWRLVLPARTSISRCRRLQLNIIVPSSVGRSVVIRRRRVVAVVVVRLLGLRLRVVGLLGVLLWVVGRCAVARRCAAESPACAAVGLETALSAAAGGYASDEC
jgi:type IV secretory pathway TrbD component